MVKMLKMQKNRKIFQTNSHKSYEILQRIYIMNHMTSHEYYQCNTKRWVEVHWNTGKKIASYCGYFSFILDVETTTFVEMYPCEEKKKWLQGIFDPSSYLKPS